MSEPTPSMHSNCPSTEAGWKFCRRCRLYTTRRNVVLNRWGACFRGRIRASSLEECRSSKFPTILFIGEAPGEQEDAAGKPFWGPSGRILNSMFSYTSYPFNFCLTNTVACRPTVLDLRGQPINREPTEAERELCKPRLNQLIESYHFSGLVYVGKVAESYRYVLKSQPGLFTKAISILHPAFILRKEYKLYDIKRAAKKIDNYIFNISKKKIK